MTKAMWAALMTAAMAGTGLAQDFVGSSSVGSSEQLYPYDDLEKWKHGYLKEMPYYHGYHSFRPYNYHHVYSQSQTAAGWGMNPASPQSQQFWHKYEQMASPGSPMISQGQRPSYEDQLVQLQIQNQAQQPIQMQNQYYGGSDVTGFGDQAMPQEVAPVVYQGTVPNTVHRPHSSDQNFGSPKTNASRNDAQSQQLRNYLNAPAQRR